VAYGAVEQSVYLPKYRLFLLTAPQWLKRGVADPLFDQLLKDLVEAKAITASCRQYASEIEFIDFLASRGFEEVSRVLDLRLNVADADVSSFAALRKEIEDQGIS